MSAPFRYARLGYVRLEVTDLARTRDFYTDVVGLTAEDTDDGALLLRCSEKLCDLKLREGESPGIKRIGFELESERDLSAARSYFEDKGAAAWWTPAKGEAEPGKIRLTAPYCGLSVEFYVAPGAERPAFAPNVAKIARLGHVVLNVSDFGAAMDFWVHLLGFAVSDHVPGQIAFLRCPPNPLHHSLALIGGKQDGLNHVNFMVSDIDDVGSAIYRMKRNSVPIVFGPGRHKPSESIFLYFLDPDGMTVEYSFGMEEFAEHDPRPPRELDPTPETLDMWGGKPEPAFGKTGAIISAHE